MERTQLGSVADAVSDVVFVVSQSGGLVEWNAAAAAAAGRDADALTDARFTDLVADADAAAVDNALAARDGVVDASLRGDGGIYTYEFTVDALPDGNAVLVGRDTGDRPDRGVVEPRERVLREMHTIVSARDRSFAEQVDALLELVRGELGVAGGALSRVDGEDAVFDVAEGSIIEPGAVTPLAETFCERVVTDRETLSLGDVDDEPPAERERGAHTENGVACYLGAPVVVDGDVYGSLCFYDTEPAGDFSDWQVTLVDLTSRWVSYELERERANQRLEQQNDHLERFASVLSHDIRNPLNVARGHLSLAEETGDDAALETAADALDRIEALVDDLLALSRAGLTIDDPTPVRLAAAAERAWGHVDTDDAALSLDTDRVVLADASRLEQLLENLVRNSVEHGSIDSRPQADGDGVEPGSTEPTAGGGSSSGSAAAGAPVHVTVGDCSDGFYVADDGPGIPSEERDSVFERGYTTAASGTGFGLAIVSEVADAHGWTVGVTESESGGARFEFTGLADGSSE